MIAIFFPVPKMTEDHDQWTKRSRKPIKIVMYRSKTSLSFRDSRFLFQNERSSNGLQKCRSWSQITVFMILPIPTKTTTKLADFTIPISIRKKTGKQNPSDYFLQILQKRYSGFANANGENTPGKFPTWIRYPKIQSNREADRQTSGQWHNVGRQTDKNWVDW